MREGPDFQERKKEMGNQEMELAREREHLAWVQDLIRKETDDLLSDLGMLRQEMAENYKYLTEEYTHKQFHLMNSESEIKENQYEAAYRRVLELSKMYDQPYFGMICFREQGEDLSEEYYIGKRGLAKDGDPVILDWRTPAASLFYQQKLGPMSFRAPSGEIAVDLLNRRQFVIKDGVLQGLFDSELDIKDDILQLVLSGSSGERLKEVVATIQKEQDDLIRAPLEENVLLDGVAGSGKTTIILHRVAFLLYNYRSRLQDNILILGPNQLFMEYISEVLPDLGETEGTYQRTLRKLAYEVLDLRYPLMSAVDYYEKLMHGRDEQWRQMVHRRADIAFAKELDEKLAAFEESNRMDKDLVFDKHMVLRAEDGNDLFFKTYHHMAYEKRVRRIKRQIFARLKELRNSALGQLQQQYAARIKAAKQQGNDDLANRLRFEEKQEIRRYLIKVLHYREELRQVYSIPQVEDWYRSWVTGDQEPWIEEDLWAMLYVAARLHGKGLFDVKHLLVDEAQDVSALGLAALMKVTGTESLTVVGDHRQKIKGAGYPSLMDQWDRAVSAPVRKQTRAYQLQTSYRSTREIMEYAMRGLPDELQCPVHTVERPGAPVITMEHPLDDALAARLKETLEQLQNDGMKRIAILTENEEQARFLALRLHPAAELISDELRRIETDKVPVIPVYLAKGMEYDAVIALDTMRDALTHYVLCTRALHRLVHIRITA